MKYWVINVPTTQWNRSHFSLRRGSICFADVIAKVVALFPQHFLVDSPAVVWTGGLSRCDHRPGGSAGDNSLLILQCNCRLPHFWHFYVKIKLQIAVWWTGASRIRSVGLLFTRSSQRGRGEKNQRGNALRAELNEITPDFIPINFKNFGISVLFDCMIYEAMWPWFSQ